MRFMLTREQDKSTAGVLLPCTIVRLTSQLDPFQSAGCCRCDNWTTRSFPPFSAALLTSDRIIAPVTRATHPN